MFASCRPKGLGAYLAYPYNLARLIASTGKLQGDDYGFAARSFGPDTTLFGSSRAWLPRHVGRPHRPRFCILFDDYWTVKGEWSSGLRLWRQLPLPGRRTPAQLAGR